MAAPVAYELEAQPARPLVGAPIVAVLRAVACADAPGALTFAHRSLIVELGRPGLAEPFLAFPNRFAVEGPSGLVRLAAGGGVEDLRAGEARERRIDLAALFGANVLAVGPLTVTYRFEEEPEAAAPPAEVEVTSGPGAVPILLERLASPDGGIRARAAELLERMFGRALGYDADAPEEARAEVARRWMVWWRDDGARLPWAFTAEGATFGEAPAPAPPDGRSDRLGGVAYPGPLP